MITLRKAEERGHANHGWLDTNHTFSFANYYDPDFLGFRSLRVINEDRVIGEAGFGTHEHRDMEIITYVLDGELEHKDSMGNVSTMSHGEIQRMSAGTGILHSEYNHSRSDQVHFLQIWILPNEKGIKPSYEQKHFNFMDEPGKLHLLVDNEAKDGSLVVHQDMKLYSGVFKKGEKVSYTFEGDRHGWLQVARGSIKLNGVDLNTSDGAAISEEKTLEIEATEDAEFLLFDLA